MKKDKPVICWWSGGITSSVACRIAIDIFGKDNCRVVFIDTHNESDDTYRFKDDCQDWYGIDIETISRIPTDYKSIEDVWYKYLSLNTAHGAICSSELKREVRIRFQKENDYSFQVFGFEFTKREFNRALSLSLNYPESNPIFPLLMRGYDKHRCIEIAQEQGIEVPESYKQGHSNNNCRKTGCIQGGVGYWQKIQREEPKVFNRMAFIEHDLTNIKGEPVTICKDQSNEAKDKPVKERLVFLEPHPDYPNNKDLSMMDGKEPEPLMECNGMCSLDDLSENKDEIDFNLMLEL